MRRLYFHEPTFFPTAQFFHGILNSDVWVVLDHIPFTPRTVLNQCRIRTSTGVQVLRVAVKPPCSKPICRMMINNFHPWKKIFLTVLRKEYKDTPYYMDYFNEVEYIINGPCTVLELLNVEIITWLAAVLGTDLKTVFSREFYRKYPKSLAIEALCRKLDGVNYVPKVETPELKAVIAENLFVLDTLFKTGAEETRRMLYEKK